MQALLIDVAEDRPSDSPDRPGWTAIAYLLASEILLQSIESTEDCQAKPSNVASVHCRKAVLAKHLGGVRANVQTHQGLTTDIERLELVQNHFIGKKIVIAAETESMPSCFDVWCIREARLLWLLHSRGKQVSAAGTKNVIADLVTQATCPDVDCAL